MKKLPPQYAIFSKERDRLVYQMYNQGGLNPEENDQLNALTDALSDMEAGRLKSGDDPVWQPN